MTSEEIRDAKFRAAVGPATVAPTERVSQIECSLRAFSGAIERLEKIVEGLEEKTRMVQAPRDVPASSPAAANPPDIVAPLAVEIGGRAARVHYLVDRLEQLYGAIEL